MSARLTLTVKTVALVIATLGVSLQAWASVPALVIDGGTTVSLRGATRLVTAGDVRATGTLAPGVGSTLVLSGFGSPALIGTPSLASLALALHGTASIAQAMTLSEGLSLQSGWLSLAGHDLLAPAISGGSSASYVVTPDTLGGLVRPVNAGTNARFPVGNSHYDPVSLRTESGADNFRVAVLDAVPPQGFPAGTGLERAWSITHPNSIGNALTHASVQWNVNEEDAQFNRTLNQPTSAVAYLWGGSAWAPKPGVRRTDNGLDPAVDSLFLANVGLWTLAGASGLDAVELPADAGIPATLQLAAPQPHPLRGNGSLRFGLPREADVSLALYDVTGARRQVLASGRQSAGWHVVPLDASRIPEGVYFLRLDVERDVRTARCVILK